MPTYIANWTKRKLDVDMKMTEVFEAPDIDIALKLASDKYPNPDCKWIDIRNDYFWSNESKIYENPHYSPSLVNEPSPKGGGKPESRPEAGRVTEPSDDTPTDLDYFIANDGETKGPYTMSQIRSMWEHGEISSKAMYATEGDTEWRRVRELVETTEREDLPSGTKPCRDCGAPCSTDVVRTKSDPISPTGNVVATTPVCMRCGCANPTLTKEENDIIQADIGSAARVRRVTFICMILGLFIMVVMWQCAATM